jgi:hypothetical protein
VVLTVCVNIYIFGWKDRERKGVCSLLPVGFENSRSWIFLQVGACKLWGRILLLVGVEELRDSVLPSCWCL